MENTVEVGMNRTGLDMAPLSKNELISFAAEKCYDAPTDDGSYAAMQAQYIQEADRIGAVPIPASMKGVIHTAKDMISGNHLEVFLDKLGERLAFERTGSRLYEALIRKCNALAEDLPPHSLTDAERGEEASLHVSKRYGAIVRLSALESILADEQAHFRLVQKAIESQGADPTAVTPCADIAGVMAQGLLQTISDPRTTIPQCLNAILTAELADNAGWELLIEIALALGHKDMAEGFAIALAAEETHLKTVKSWLRDAMVSEAT